VDQSERRTIVVIEDDHDVQSVLGRLLELGGYRTTICPDGESGLRACLEQQPSLVILDLGLPLLDGSEVLAQLRVVSDVPILVVSARTGEMEKVKQLAAGADDYLQKPFGRLELLARIEALLRRSRTGGDTQPTTIGDGEVRLDLVGREVTVTGKIVTLSKTEFATLAALLRTPGRAVPNRELLREAWHDVSGVGAERIRFTVTRLRKKLGEQAGDRIVPVRGYGYRWVTGGSATPDGGDNPGSTPGASTETRFPVASGEDRRNDWAELLAQ
jgi:DNA-binding response OmpR family regulator